MKHRYTAYIRRTNISWIYRFVVSVEEYERRIATQRVNENENKDKDKDKDKDNKETNTSSVNNKNEMVELEEPPKKRRRKRGQNNSRYQQNKIHYTKKLCPNIIQGVKCDYGDKLGFTAHI